jgi:hypothetical protein|tara:strand:+ start:1269 stop:1448 length:180 start_codon:yes stop_codon:yes gene_type:complete
MKLANMMVDYLCNEETKEEIIKKLNDRIDIPIINEKTEAKVLNSIYSVVEDVIKKVLLK